MFRLVSQVRTYLPKTKVPLHLSPAPLFLASNPSILYSFRNFSNTLINMAEPDTPELTGGSSPLNNNGGAASSGDITCTCSDCKQQFIHPVADQVSLINKLYSF